MGRAPCCEKMGLKKGPWTPQEDRLLISYIQLHGHSNWRALPKLAGLLRCGKSCRLRWVNYLKPDIKRGNFTPEEEASILKLHEVLGNRWSAIAARLPGRTDNEIKNVWHTHLKKRLNDHQTSQLKPKKTLIMEPISKKNMLATRGSTHAQSSATTTINTEISSGTDASSTQTFPAIDESFWSEDITFDDIEMISKIDRNVHRSKDLGLARHEAGCRDGEKDFWYNVFVSAGGLPELPEF